MKIKAKKSHQKITTPLIVVTVLLLVAASCVYLASQNNWWPFHNSSRELGNADENTIDLLPPTDEQVNSGYSSKEKTPKNDFSSPKYDEATKEPSQKEKKPVLVTITNYRKDGSTVHVNAIVNTQTDGECTATLKKSGQTISTIKGGTFTQSSFVSCTDLNLTADTIAPGSYTLKVGFSNDSQEGSMSQDISL